MAITITQIEQLAQFEFECDPSARVCLPTKEFKNLLKCVPSKTQNLRHPPFFLFIILLSAAQYFVYLSFAKNRVVATER